MRMGTVYAQHSCAVGMPNGGTTYLHKGEAYDDQHLVVKAKPHLFAPPAAETDGEPQPDEEPRAATRRSKPPRAVSSSAVDNS